ncbi:MAG: A/G-specific adenine glycosylase [Chloroflexi bacterium]|nr:A/G-specific adenine glycosylase [Chloroflexota bacterium]
MAQQTQAARAADYWARFLAEFPTVQALAAATPADVLRAWRGLGYNRRALALRAAAIAIVRDHGGRVPKDLAALLRLPGVGPYTARAVAALAFGRRVGAVDVNVRRVLSRAIGGDLGSLSPAELQAVADASVPADRPGTWTHALMDIGATFCGPRLPRCAACPARVACRFALDRAGGQTASPSPDQPARHSARAARDCPARRSARAAREGPARRTARSARERPAPFETTSRWLRGRLLDILRDAPDGTWAKLPARLGSHDAASIASTVEVLAREGLAERHPTDLALARLPIA